MRRKRPKALRGLRGAFCFCVALSFSGSPVGSGAWAGTVLDEALLDATQLARSGARQLALDVLSRQQPNRTRDVKNWQRWTELRVDILFRSGDWAGVTRALQALPEGLSPPFRAFALERLARAFLALKRGAAARTQLRKLLWSTGAQVQNAKRWRRLVIESYLADGLFDDARTAVIRYRQDFGDRGTDWTILQARVALDGGDAQRALAILGKAKGLTESVLRLKALVRARGIERKPLLRSVTRLLNDGNIAPEMRRDLWRAVAEFAANRHDAALAVRAAEQVIGADAVEQPQAGADLWRAYANLAQEAANEHRLLIGAYSDWLKYADGLPAGAITRRAVYAAVIAEANGDARAAAAERLVVAFANRESGMQILAALFAAGDRFKNAAAIPIAIRYPLVDYALSRGDIVRARALMAGLNRPPKGVAAFDWQLRRARVLVLGGDRRGGGAVLREILKTAGKLGSEQADRLNQVLFDLQASGGHALAFDVFAASLDHAPNAKYVRETLFWMADSLAAEDHHAAAAQLYLKSAMLPGVATMDQWAQSARYQAAQSLSKAGFDDDARALYRALLAVTDKPAKRAILIRALQRLPARRTRDER